MAMVLQAVSMIGLEMTNNDAQLKHVQRIYALLFPLFHLCFPLSLLLENLWCQPSTLHIVMRYRGRATGSPIFQKTRSKYT